MGTTTVALFGLVILLIFNIATWDQLVKNYISPEEYKSGYGRELFKNNRAQVTNSENGAISIG